MDCNQISPVSQTDDADCLVNVTYTYAVENTGALDFYIWQFLRTRNGVTNDLIPLFGDDTFVTMGDTKSVQETEELNRCTSALDESTFKTNTTVRREPLYEDLCLNTYYFPNRLGPDWTNLVNYNDY